VITIDSVIMIGSAVAVASLAYFYKRSEIRTYFSKSKDSPENELIDLINKAKTSIDVAVFYISETEIVSHLCSATERGIKVRIITDREAESTNKNALEQFLRCGIAVKVNTYEGRMHLKNMIVDDKIIATGSYNYTYGAEHKNEEVLVIIKDKSVAKEWTAKFNEMWNHEANYKSYN
jgi:phosphatidylserine/phosphatidylglycerophosphate/cardiolipin synthase-like enzyme